MNAHSMISVQEYADLKGGYMSDLYTYALTISKYLIIGLSVLILARCLRSMLRDRFEPEVWSYILAGDVKIPVNHWESIIGRGISADIRVKGRGISRVHAVLRRTDTGHWYVYDVFSKGGVRVNDQWAGFGAGMLVRSGDMITLGQSTVHFQDLAPEEHRQMEAGRTKAGRSVVPAVTLAELTLFQVLLLMQLAIHYSESEYLLTITASFAALILLEWCVYNAMKVMDRSGFEVETLAFYLTSLGMAVSASSVPEDMFKQLILTMVSVVLFLLTGWWLRKLSRTKALRIRIAVLALALLAVNVLFSESVFGARNWLEFGGFSFQPSELVKFGYVYVGAATMDTLYRKENLYYFIGFSAICVVALALIGDFGTALVFFVCFLVISFMRSGSLATVLLSVSGAVLAGFLALSVRPYIAQRFASWGHVWEDVYDKGYQQTRAMSAAASGGLIGKGAGGGWLKTVFAANTDMVYAVVAEEEGLIVSVCAVLAVILMAFFAVRLTRRSRSSMPSPPARQWQSC